MQARHDGAAAKTWLNLAQKSFGMHYRNSTFSFEKGDDE